MRKREYIKFIILFSIFLGVYFLCITNANIFIKNYDDKIITYQNNYKLDTTSNNILNYIFDGSEFRVGNFEDLEEIFNNSYTMDLLSNFLEKNDDEMNEYLNNLVKSNMVSIINSRFYDEELIYLTEPEYTIVLTKNGENIYYNRFLKGDTCTNIESNDSSIEIITKNVQNQIENLGITKKIGFNITSIRKSPSTEFKELYGKVYYIEDSENDLKILYEVNCDKIYNLSLGFTNIKTY